MQHSKYISHISRIQTKTNTFRHPQPHIFIHEKALGQVSWPSNKAGPRLGSRWVTGGAGTPPEAQPPASWAPKRDDFAAFRMLMTPQGFVVWFRICCVRFEFWLFFRFCLWFVNLIVGLDVQWIVKWMFVWFQLELI